MIDWMQRHRKYLVITIWISTIAFVGAGFVGWGAYSFGGGSMTSIAKVGNRNISRNVFQIRYVKLFSELSQMGNFTKEDAKKINLQGKVFQSLINEELLLNYADKLGFTATTKDLEDALAKDVLFQTNGKFSIEKFKYFLRGYNLSEDDYQEYLKRNVLLSKVQNILNISPNQNEIDLFASLLYMQDKLSIDIVSVNPENISVNDEQLKAFWEPMKDKFLTKPTYEIKSKFFALETSDVKEDKLKSFYDEKKYMFTDENGNVKSFEDAKENVKKEVNFQNTKVTASKAYIAIRDGKDKIEDTQTIKEDDKNFPIELLKTAKPSETLKPFKQENGYIVTQLIKINKPAPMTFDQAKPMIEPLYRATQAKKDLEKKAKEALENFSGNDIGFVGADSNTSIDGLTMQQTRYFIDNLRLTDKKNGYVLLDNKAVVYEILEQNLLDKQKADKNKKLLTERTKQFLSQELYVNLLGRLQKQYKIEVYNQNTKKGK